MGFSFRGLFLAGLCCAGLMLSGCSEEFFDPSSFGVFQSTDVNLTDRSYAAADYLSHQAKTFIDAEDVIKATTLLDGDESRVQSKFGRVVSEQVGIRLSQLGYRMDLSEVSSDEQAQHLGAAAGAGSRVDFFLSGTYRRRRTDVDVSLHIIDARSKRVVAVFDYTLPMNGEIAKMAEPETRIFRVSE